MTILPLTVAVPLAGAALLVTVGYFVGRAVANVAALAATAATTVFCAILLARSGGVEIHWFGGWEPRHGVAIGIDFAVDAIGAGLATLVGVLMIAALVLMVRYRDTDAPHFQVLMLVFLAGMVGLCLSGDLFNMFVFFELMSVAAFALAGYRVESQSIEGSLNFAVTNTLGSFMILIGLALTYARTGALNLAQIGHALASGPAPDGLVVVAFALIACGFLVKAAAVPFHFWLADAYAVAPTPVCLLFAGAMSELGIYAVGRIWFDSFGEALAPHTGDLRTVLLIAGATTTLVGGFMCLAQDHLKRLLAFATISYVGVFLLGLAVLSADGIAGAALYVVADGFGKAALFAAVGIVQHRRQEVSVSRLHGRCRDLRWTALVVVIGVLSFASIPPLGTFFAKALLEDALIVEGHGWAIAVLVAGSALTTAAVLKAAARIFLGWGERSEPEETTEDAEGEEEASPERTPAVMWAPAALLALAALAVGLVPGMVEAAQHAAERFVDGAAYGRAVLDGAELRPIPPPPEFTAKWTAYLYTGITVFLALGLAAVGLWAERSRVGPLRWATGAAERAIAPLRRFHSGHPGDYVTFLVLGIAAFGGAFALALQ